MVARIAQWRKMNYVVKVSNQPIIGDRSQLGDGRHLQSTMVYADPRNDITNDVIYNLNRFYKATASPAPKAADGAAARPASRPTPPRRTELSRPVRSERVGDRSSSGRSRPAGRGRLAAESAWRAQDALEPPASRTLGLAQGCDEGAGNAQSHASGAHARPHGGGAWGWVFPRGRRRRFDSARPRPGRASSSCGPTCPIDRRCPPGSTGRPVPAPHHDPAGRGDRRDDRARDGRPGRPADRQLRRRDRRRRMPGLRRFEPGLRRGARSAPGSSSRTGCARPWCSNGSVSVREGDAVLAAHPRCCRTG